MYLPNEFHQTDQDEIDAYLRAFPLATVITVVDGQLWPTQVPLVRYGDSLIGHVARANDMWRHDGNVDLLAIFGGADAYITPNWYPRKQHTNEIVPTWNYASVNIWGTLSLHDDLKWKRMAVGKLTVQQERGTQHPWKMGDAPLSYLDEQMEHIIGVEIAITRCEAKWKMSQNRSHVDREGVIDGLNARDIGADASVATLMRRANPISDD